MAEESSYNRILKTIKSAQNDQHEYIADLIEAAIILMDTLYNQDCNEQDANKKLFNLRKTVEGVFGDDWPNSDEDELDELGEF